MNRKECLLLLFGLLIEGMCIVYRFAPGHIGQIIIKYMAVFSLFFILMLGAFLLVRKNEFSRIMIYTVFIGAVIFQVTLLPSRPDLSDDMYRYVWDGKLQNMGVNPYAYAPSDPRLKPFHSADLPGRVNFPHLSTIYPPAAQGVFALAYAIFHESLTGMKALFVLFHLGSMFLFYRILGIRKQPRALLLLYAWNPLPIMETAVNGHLDPLFVFFILLALFCFYRRRMFLAGVSLGLSILGKVIPLIAVPAFLWEIGKGARQSQADRAVSGRDRISRFPLLASVPSLHPELVALRHVLFLAVVFQQSVFPTAPPLFPGQCPGPSFRRASPSPVRSPAFFFDPGALKRGSSTRFSCSSC